MQVEEAIRSYLEATAGVAALVKTRVYLEKLPQSVRYPAVRVKLVSDPRDYHLRGAQGTTRARLQIDAYQDEAKPDPYGTAGAVAEAIFAALSGRRFAIGEGSPPDLIVTGAFCVSRRSMTEEAELRLARISQDFLIWSRQP